MSAKKLSAKFRTWIEIDAAAAKHNYQVFRKLIGSRVKLWAVVKSNAYGHGLFLFSKLLNSLGVDGFCVDSLVEGVKLRQIGIRKPILVLGPTLPALFPAAARNNIILSISTLENLRELVRLKDPPQFHLKIDTGMHRRGFLREGWVRIPPILSKNPKARKAFTGIYTHFAAATKVPVPVSLRAQFKKFQAAIKLFAEAGYTKLIRHSAATGGALINPNFSLDAVRIGKGLYGYLPSPDLPRLPLKPVLAWKTVITEIKKIPRGERVGYDLTERLKRPTTIAILPVGYWQGYSRGLSSVGEVLVRGHRARVLGRVSMDLTVVDVTRIPCRVGDTVTLLGREGKELIGAQELSERSGTSAYEFLTRLNPLIERILRD